MKPVSPNIIHLIRALQAQTVQWALWAQCQLTDVCSVLKFVGKFYPSQHGQILAVQVHKQEYPCNDHLAVKVNLEVVAIHFVQ